MAVILEELKIHRFRNVRPGTVLKLGHPFTVLLGRNATGKTTLLSLISAVLQGVYPFPSEDIHLEYRFKTPDGTVEGEVLSESLRKLNPLSDVKTKFWITKLSHEYQQYENIKLRDQQGNGLDLIYEPSLRQYKLQSPPFPEKSVNVSMGSRRHAYLATPWNETAQENLSESLRQTSFFNTTRFDEGLEHYAGITSPHQPNDQDGTTPVVQAIFKKRKLITLSASEAFPLSIDDFSIMLRKLESLYKDSVNKNEDISEIRFDSQDLTWLKTFTEQANFAKTSLRFEMIQRNKGETDALLFGNPSFEFIKKDGSSIIHSLLSYGQKRLLSFVCYLANNRAFVVADELVNGLHHEWIDFCMGELSQRQSFLASQNPLLLDYLSFSSAEEVASSFILCKTDVVDGKESMCWEQMSQEEAQEFFKSYQIGFQHVSEILKNKGLW